MDDDAPITSYIESLLVNFGAAYAATQESIRTQATTMAAMQGQLTNIQQFCMSVGQQPPPNIYTSAQQQNTFNNRCDRHNGGGHNNVVTGGGNGGGNFPQLGPACNNPIVLPLPTSVGRIGTTAIPMMATLMMPT